MRCEKVAKGYNVKGMADKIQALKQTAIELKTISGGIPTVDRNVDRILASIRMLEINIGELADYTS